MTPRRAAWLLAAALTASGCTLFHGSFPDDRCTDDNDCFRAQGEVCDLEDGVCRQAADAAPTPDAAPRPDAAPPPDAGDPDAGDLPDAGATDAAPADAAPLTGGVP